MRRGCASGGVHRACASGVCVGGGAPRGVRDYWFPAGGREEGGRWRERGSGREEVGGGGSEEVGEGEREREREGEREGEREREGAREGRVCLEAEAQRNNNNNNKKKKNNNNEY